MTLLHIKKRHNTARKTFYIAITCGILFTCLILFIFLRLDKKVDQENIVIPSADIAMQQVSEQYENQVRQLQLELQTTDKDDITLQQEVEAFLLDVRVPKEKLDTHLSVTLRVRSLHESGADAPALISLLEQLVSY